MQRNGHIHTPTHIFAVMRPSYFAVQGWKRWLFPNPAKNQDADLDTIYGQNIQGRQCPMVFHDASRAMASCRHLVTTNAGQAALSAAFVVDYREREPPKEQGGIADRTAWPQWTGPISRARCEVDGRPHGRRGGRGGGFIGVTLGRTARGAIRCTMCCRQFHPDSFRAIHGPVATIQCIHRRLAQTITHRHDLHASQATLAKYGDVLLRLGARAGEPVDSGGAPCAAEGAGSRAKMREQLRHGADVRASIVDGEDRKAWLTRYITLQQAVVVEYLHAVAA